MMENSSISELTPTSVGDEHAKLDYDGAHVLDVVVLPGRPRLRDIEWRERTRGGTGSGNTVTLGSRHTARRCA